MAVRSYGQFCPAAHALDLVGDRWTLLVVRELLAGPKRYTDLQFGLPGIGPTLLVDRLRALETNRLIIKRRIAGQSSGMVYELTEAGAGLRQVLDALFAWGMERIDQPKSSEAIRASYWLPALRAAIAPSMISPEVNESYRFIVGSEEFAVTINGGEVDVSVAHSASADLLVRMDPATFIAIGRGQTTPKAAADSGRLTFDGSTEAAARCAALFSKPVHLAVAVRARRK